MASSSCLWVLYTRSPSGRRETKVTDAPTPVPPPLPALTTALACLPVPRISSYPGKAKTSLFEAPLDSQG